jgi:hypothetical protein
MSRNVSYKDLQVGTAVLIKGESNPRVIKKRKYAADGTTLILWFENGSHNTGVNNWEYARNVVKIIPKTNVYTKTNGKELISIDKEYITVNGQKIKLFEFFENRWWGIIELSKDVWVSISWDKYGENTGYDKNTGYDLIEKPVFEINAFKQQKIIKSVLYFGYRLDVPVDTKYIATNKSGWIYAYPVEVGVIRVNERVIPTSFVAIDESKRLYEIGTLVGFAENYSGGWKNSLVKLES